MIISQSAFWLFYCCYVMEWKHYTYELSDVFIFTFMMRWTFRTAFGCGYLWVLNFSSCFWCIFPSRLRFILPLFFYGIRINLVIFFIAYNFEIIAFLWGWSPRTVGFSSWLGSIAGCFRSRGRGVRTSCRGRFWSCSFRTIRSFLIGSFRVVLADLSFGRLKTNSFRWFNLFFLHKFKFTFILVYFPFQRTIFLSKIGQILFKCIILFFKQINLLHLVCHKRANDLIDCCWNHR